MKIQFIGIDAPFILDHTFKNNKDYNKKKSYYMILKRLLIQ